MERHFELELEKLNNRILKMGEMVSGQVHQSMQALINGDVELAREIIAMDSKVDKLDVKIDKLCQRIFALTQPVATDLRLIMSALRMNNDLERMGDHAVSVAERVEAVADYRNSIKELGLEEVLQMTDLIVRDVMNILRTRNTAFVKDIFQLAQNISERSQAVSARIIEEMMHKTEVISVATQLIMVLTTMERLAAYSTNIAEAVVFIVDGKLVKHKKLQVDSRDGDESLVEPDPEEGE